MALLALMVGPPLALLVTVGNPIPEQAVVGGQITDAAVVGLLAGVVWLAWAQLGVVIAVEATAAVRGRALPRTIPGCGFSQHLARRLVVTASLLLAGAGPLVATAGAVASPAVAATTVAGCRTEPTASPAPRLALPASTTDRATARPVAHAASASLPDLQPVVRDVEPNELSYVVRPPQGHHYDSLWDIAERHLGEGRRWREIYDLNRHRAQPDGQRLELARLIQPGWRLLMPADATGIHAEKEKTRSEPRTLDRPSTPARADLAPADEAAPTVPLARRADDAPSASTAAAARRVQLGPTPTVPSPAAAGTATPGPGVSAAAVDVESVEQDDDVAIPFGQLTLGLGAVACAALVAELARRRRRAQRFRRPGERLPRPSEPAAAAERRLRAANAELSVTDLRDALRLLAHHCRAEGRALPDVHAITLNAAGATLHLEADADPVAPFRAGGDRAWCLDSAVLAAADRTDLAENGMDPYPALVSLGVTDDAVLLVNLEAAGTLTIAGNSVEATPILHALVAELGTSLLSATAHVVLTDCPPELAAMLDHGRVTLLDPHQAEQWAHARGREVGSILQAAGVPDVGGARTRGVADDVWAPAVLLVGASTGDVPEPAAEVTVVRVAESAGTGWALRRTDGGWRFDPLGVALTPQRLDLHGLGPLAEALATAESPARAPKDLDSAGPSSTPTHDPAEETTAADPNPAPLPEAATRPLRTVPRPAGPADDEPVLPAPRVLVLGPVEITGVAEDGAPGRKRRATELVAYLALHPGASQYQLDEALWPGCRVPRNTRNPLVSRTRQWLGTNPEGEHYLGLVGEGGHYNLGSAVTCDWHEFQALAARGIAAGEDGLDDLEAAMRLVRGRPFVGVYPAAYGWAESATQDMISAIVDVAHVTVERALARGDARRARWAAGRCLTVEPCSELLVQDAIRAAKALGDTEDADRLVAALRRQIQDLDPDDDLDGVPASVAAVRPGSVR
ncbi:MAG: hypothetical protein ACT4QF_02545 [Sporichthyaceae bacterium]